MMLRDFLPGPAVREFVQWYRIVHFEFDKSENIPIKAYPPKPEQTLHFFLRDPFEIENTVGKKFHAPSMLFTAQQTSLVRHHTGRDFLDVQIVFLPTAIFRLTGIPANELINQFFEATNLFTKDIHSTFAQLQELTSYTDIIKIAETFVHKLIHNARKESLPIDSVCQQMIQSKRNSSLKLLAKESCYCLKKFDRKFIERTGLNPKTYSRIIRLNRTYNMRNQFPGKDWSYIATECGYFDYQHLAKDYKEYAKDFDKTRIALNVPCKKIYRLKSSHSPFFSMPDTLADILEEIYHFSKVEVLQ